MIFAHIFTINSESRGSGRSSSATIADYRLEIFKSKNSLTIEGTGNHSNMWGDSIGTYTAFIDRLSVHIGKEDLIKMFQFALENGLIASSDLQIFPQSENGENSK